MHSFFINKTFIALSRPLKATLAVIAFLFLGVQYANGQAVICPPNIDFSYGNLNNWFCYTGDVIPGTTGSPAQFVNVIYSGPVPGTLPAPSVTSTNRHNVTTGTAVDAYGGFPIVAPGGGIFSMILGNNDINAHGERIRYYVHVPVGFNNYSFNFKYAVVFEDPGHPYEQQPAFRVIAYDSATGTPIPCATLTYVAGAGLPGFFTSPAASGVLCLPWTNGTLNLSGQGGKTIIVEVTSQDCTASGHFGYGYFDIISCGQFAAAVTYCNLSAGIVTLSAPFGYASYKWYKGPVIAGAPIANAQSVNIPAPATPTYYYCVLFPYNTNGCPDTIRTRTISNFTVNASPDTVCNSLGKPIQLSVVATGGLGGFNYNWLSDPTLAPNPPLTTSLSGILNTTNNGSVIASPTGSGFYVVTVSDSIGCFRQDTVIIQNPNFQLQLGPDITTCLGTAVTLSPSLTPLSPGYTYKWTGSNVTTNLSNATILNPVYTPSKLGYDTFFLRVDSGVCATKDSFRIRTLPNSFLVTDTQVCQYAQFNPNVSGDVNFTYTWSPTLGLVNGLADVNKQRPLLALDTSRSYTVTARYPTCPDIVNTISFRVEPIPNIDLGPKDTVDKCFYTPLYLTAKVTPTWFPDYQYLWKANKDIDDIHASQITFTGIIDTTLVVTVSTPLGCTNKDSIRVNVYAGKFGSVTPSDSAVCPRNPVTLTASGGVSYLWRPSLYLSDSTKASVTANLGATTTYTVYVKDKNGCVDTLPVNLQVYSAALVSLPDSAILWPGQSFQMSPSGNALYFSWFPTVGLDNPNISNPMATPSVNTRYFVTATTEAGCTAVDSIYVLVNDETVLNMANAFSPGSAPNPEFKVSHLGTATLKSFRIFNRWGTKVFETTDINKGWNGQFNGEPQPMGVYIYTVEAITNKGKTFTKQGNVTLVR